MAASKAVRFMVLPVRKLTLAVLVALFVQTQWLLPARTETFKLEGHVEHSDKLPPVDPEMQVGRKFDEKHLTPPHNAVTTDWWRVPSWLVGSWQNIGKVRQLLLEDLQTHQRFESDGRATPVIYPDQEIIGLQKDRQGEVWTTVPTPYLTRDQERKTLNVNRVTMVEPVRVSEQEVVLRLLATTFVVHLPDNDIVSVVQRESIQTYRPMENGKIIVLASMKFFDEHGLPKFSRQVLTHSRKHSGFTEMQYWTSPGTGLAIIDLRKSFEDFLRKQNLIELIPVRRKIS